MPPTSIRNWCRCFCDEAGTGSATRVKKTGQYGTTYYIGKHFEIVNGVKTKHIFAGGMRIAQISNGVRYYHHKDHLGSTIGVTNDAGWLVWASDYEPYGLPRSAWWKTPSMDSLIRHRFTDQEYDAETRLYNFNARLYDPSIARFISPDTIVDNPYSSLALNRYMYVAGNPLRYTDPSGHLKIGKFFKRATHGITRVLKYHARQGVTGITYDVNRAFERLCGSSDICEALEYPIDAVVAPTAFISAYAALVVTSPGKAISDPAWLISNGMAAFNLSAPGQVINAAVTYTITGSPRLAKPDKYGGYPIMKNSMFGYIGGDGFTPGPVSFIDPEKSNNNKLIMHETGHQMQYDQWGGWKYLITGLSDAGNDGSFEYGADVNATNHFSSQLNGDSVCTYHSQNHPIEACRY